MRAEGATILDPIELPEELRFGNEHEMEVLYHEFKADLNNYLQSLGPDAPIRSLEELIDYNEQSADLELSLFGQDLLAQTPGVASAGVGALPGLPHHAPKAKRIIYLFQSGAP